MATASLDALKTFLVVAQEESFTRAAVKLGQDKSQVSRVVRGLESVLEVVLLARTTRSVKLTAEGEALVARISPLLVGLEEAVAAVPGRGEIPSGEVVITATPDVGRALLAPALVGFRARYPSVRVRVVLSNELVNLMGEGVDLALRVGKPGGQGLVARKLCELDAGFFASHAYLERRGTPTRLDELAQHETLWPTPAKGQRSFAPGPVTTKASVTGEFGFLAELARAGGGIALLPTFLAPEGVLTRVLPEFVLGGAPLYLVSRPHRPLPARVAVLRAHVISRVSLAAASSQGER